MKVVLVKGMFCVWCCAVVLMETLYECAHSAFLKGLPYGWAWSTAVEKTLLVKLFVDVTKVHPFDEFQLQV